ncbi:Pro-Hyp dipeptidase. Metallo peptidase. MEROPS family M38 [Duganella sp. CF402]|uniref:Xaa-Pro dipeptidase n=1 Tax=unclassified Duganella TaxID=2636909 RepID=UPI0008AF3F46|nr:MULTISPECIES: amidohydrolase family protein [unclassified Duganella]RZT11301.1 imidazolonepropionase-like amidohydrolase [Duganella sp. BK701]SEK71614.1 Pro-Hyp dipeptidase. Metallo peptidase. MEROPS family M38 [Duganella sp. CF402]
MKAITSSILMLACAAAYAADPATIAVKAAHMVDVRNGTLVDNAVVLISGDRITAAGSKLAIPAGAQVIDLGNKTLLPGLIDSHTHITGAPEDAGYSLIAKSVPRMTLQGAKNALVTLRAGFTTIRDVGADNYTDIGLRDAINDGDVPGPRILASGPPLSITGGHCDDTMHAPEYKLTALGVADGADEAMKVTRRNIKYGADVIKICATGGVLSFGDDPRTSQYTLEELKAIISDAHRLGRKTAAHAHGGDGIKLSVLAGVDSIEHGSYIDEEGIKLMKEHKTYLVPTLYLGDWLIENAEAIKLPKPLLEKAKVVLPTARVNIGKAIKAGVPIAFGTDAAVYPHGLNAREFGVLVKLGMTPAQAIRTATVNAADLLGWSDKVGSIEAGKYADLIAVDGEPLKDVKTLEQVQWVMKGGAVVK